VRLTESEAIGFVVAALAVGEQSASRCIRELTAWGIAQVFTNRDIEIHDAFRGVIADMAALDQAAVRHVRTVLGALLKKSISFKRPERLLAYARIAPLIGEARVVADIASRMPEHFHEHGMDVALQRVLSDMASDASLSTDEQFEVTDTLTFWNIQRGVDAKLVQQQIATLERLLQSVINKRWAHQAIAIKRLHTVTTLADARRVYADNIPHFFDEPHPWLILRYTYAVALLSLGDLEAADLVSKTVVMGYLNFVGLRPDELFARNAPEIRASLGQRANDIEDLKHVADAIELRSRVVGAKGGAVALLKIWAFKIYALANAPSSAVKVGKDFIDALVSIGEISEARSFMEKTLLPGIAEFGLVEELVPLRAQHAVVIAYAGDTGLAIKEIRELAVFKSTSPLLEAELTNQERLIHAIASGQYRLPIARERNLGRSGALVDSLQLRGGRNEPCMCGSGVKQKRCCGR
jgi:hypothetical protein